MKRLLLFSINCLVALQLFAQVGINNHHITNYDLGTVLNTVTKNNTTWLAQIYAGDDPMQYEDHLVKTTNGGGDYIEINSPALISSGIRKFASVGDTVIGVGDKILMSTDFGDTWTIMPKPNQNEYYDGVTIMPDGQVWITGFTGSTSCLYQTDYSFSNYELKHSVPTPVAISGLYLQLSSFSSDTVFFAMRDTLDFKIFHSTNNGDTWSSNNLNIDSLYFVLGDTSSIMVGSARLTYIKYFDAEHAHIFTTASSFTKDFFTTDGFTSLKIDTNGPLHTAYQVTNWISCEDNHYLIFDHNEDSNGGMQEVSVGNDNMLVLGTYIWGSTLNFSHRGSAATGGASELFISAFSNLCTPASVTKTNASESVTVSPNPSAGIFHINTTEPLKWSVYDVMGKNIISGNKKEISLEEYSSGVYFLILSDKKRVIKLLKK